MQKTKAIYDETFGPRFVYTCVHKALELKSSSLSVEMHVQERKHLILKRNIRLVINSFNTASFLKRTHAYFYTTQVFSSSVFALMPSSA